MAITRRNFLIGLGGIGVTLACNLPVTAPLTPTDPPTKEIEIVPTTIPQETSADATPLRRQIGQMVMVGFRGLTPEDSAETLQQIRGLNLGGLFLFDIDVATGGIRNISSAGQLKELVTALQKAATLPLLIGIDQEGGNVARLNPRMGFPETTSAEQLGATNDLEKTKATGTATATLLKELGINLNLAPVVDLNRNPQNPIIGELGRSFSADPKITTTHATAFIKAHHTNGVFCTLKHFPGHGSGSAHSHLGFVDVTSQWSSDELLPYETLITNKLADLIMTAHIYNAQLDRDFPATLSEKIIGGILRQQMGYQGVIISDDIQMGAITQYYGLETAVIQAVKAGVDIIAIANNSATVPYDPSAALKAIDAIESGVQQGILSAARIQESYSRIQTLKSRL